MTATSSPNPRLTAGVIATAVVTFTLLLHVTFPNMGGAGLRMPFNATVWMGFALLMALALWPATRGVIRYSHFHLGVGLLLLALWAPFAWSWNPASMIAFPRLLGATAGAILLLGLAQLRLQRRDWWWLGLAILLGALVASAFGYAQRYWLVEGNWMGYDPNYGRPYGIFQQVNVMTSFLVTALVISAWLYGEARQRWERGVILLAPLVMPALVLMIQSRTGWLAALLALPLVMAHLHGQDRRRFAQWAGALGLGIALGGLLWWAPWSATGGDSLTARELARGGERLPVYLHSLKMILEEPLSGWGYGRFQHDFLHSFADWRASLPINQPVIVDPIITQNYSHPHNELLLWGVEGGLLPMAAILAFGGWVLWRIIAHGPRGERLLYCALLLPLTLHAMTEYPFYHSIAHWLAFLLLLGLVAEHCWPSRERANRYTFGIRVGGWLAVPVLWAFMATHLQTLWQVKIHLETRGHNPVALGQAINPLGIPHDLEYLSMSQQLQSSANLGIIGVIEDYLNWAEKRARTLPTPTLYARMLESEALLGASDKRITGNAAHLYPAFREIKTVLENIATHPEKPHYNSRFKQ
ncbi:PglL family O-oligosaccharyltransferase [Halomonas sp. 328]|uniref:PglL family O-oligosaccharyltransferase n=1 Tax=Halomonas sp. 328 TaxID=2776704 RepID=UPI0018A721CE|nr:Wzy polymerase domain-containing protein [Halomonas sp. 328]MBF8224499.1 O-antigen ligase C-terminal domain-containing protein [Halomonas sp. 328]